jgi:translation initiation factor 5B
LLKKEGFTLRKADIGNITRKDIMEAASLQCENPLLGVVLGFNVEVDADAKIEAEKRGIRIFNEKVIYHLIENYRSWVDESNRLAKSNELACLVWPVEFELLRGKVFRNTKPAIVGVKILEGKLRDGWRVMNKNGEIIGTIQGLQNEGKAVKEANRGDELAVSIDGGNVGRNLTEGEHLFSCIPAKQYCDLEKYLSDFTDEEKKLLTLIKGKQATEEEQ